MRDIYVYGIYNMHAPICIYIIYTYTYIYIHTCHPLSLCVTTATRILPGCSASPRGLQTLWTRPKLVGSGEPRLLKIYGALRLFNTIYRGYPAFNYINIILGNGILWGVAMENEPFAYWARWFSIAVLNYQRASYCRCSNLYYWNVSRLQLCAFILSCIDILCYRYAQMNNITQVNG